MSNLSSETSAPEVKVSTPPGPPPGDSEADTTGHREEVAVRFQDRFVRLMKILAPYVSVQIVVQLLNSLVGFLIVRSLTVPEYAIYTIAVTIQGTLIVLADVGITSALSGTGGKVWQDPHRFGQLIKTGLQMRVVLASVVLIVAMPVMVWMFLTNGVPLPYTIMMIIALLLGAGARLNSDILSIVPKIKGQVKRLQRFDLIGAVLRIAFVGVLYLTTLNAFLAVLTASMAAYLQNIRLLKWVKSDIDWNAPPNEADKTEVIAVIRRQLLNTLYYCAQGQITLTVVSLFGNTSNIAELGALGKLSVIFTILSSVFANLVLPRFAREQSWRKLLGIYYLSVVALAIVSGLLMGITLLFPDAVLWILGPGYSHLRKELAYSIFSAILMSFTGLIFGLNSARAWLGYLWVTIPIMLVTQVLLAYRLDLSKIENVMLLCSLPYAISCIVPVYTFANEIGKMKASSSGD